MPHERPRSAGSNGIETDVSFDARGHPQETFHGLPCDCNRHCYHHEKFLRFVQHLAKSTVPPAAASRLYLVLFDLKLKGLKDVRQKETAGLALAEILHKNLYSVYETAARLYKRQLVLQPPLRVVISINHAHDMPLVSSFIGYMRQNRLDLMSRQVGFDVGMNDNLSEILQAWDGLHGATVNIWQGDGLTNCANLVRGHERLRQAIGMRNEQAHFRKVYYWTADIMFHIRAVMRLGLDAVLTNQPQRVNQVLKEPEFAAKYRLATAFDDPFQQFWIRPSAAKGFGAPSVSETVETIANIQKSSSNFVKTLPDGLMAALRKVQQSIGLPSPA